MMGSYCLLELTTRNKERRQQWDRQRELATSANLPVPVDGTNGIAKSTMKTWASRTAARIGKKITEHGEGTEQWLDRCPRFLGTARFARDFFPVSYLWDFRFPVARLRRLDFNKWIKL
jgi:hypothetical protein